MEPKEEQIQMPDTPEPADGTPKETALEIEESAEKPENTDDMDGVPAMEISDAGAAEENNPDFDMTPTAEQDFIPEEEKPTPPPKAAVLEQTEENVRWSAPAGTARHLLLLPEGRHPLPSSP